MLNFGNKEFRNLQEQVLKNAQDIEVLKGRTNLQVVIVEELPEEGNPNYIYLVPDDEGEQPDVYKEYIWLVDEERYELIGGVSIDLTNYVTLDTTQTISGAKTFSANIAASGDIQVTGSIKIGNEILKETSGNLSIEVSGDSKAVMPTWNGHYNLGASGYKWKDLFISGNIDFGDNAKIQKDASNRVNVLFGNTAIVKVGTPSYIKASFLPEDNNTHDLGSGTYAWKDAYIAGNISDGTNSTKVANISTKVTSSYQSGTFDSNGETSLLIYGDIPTGLFIFAYGNCECLLHLTETMVENADATPIRVAIPMMYNSAAVNGWLEISRSTYTFTFRITDGTNHVDSGYAWTLTKTNLL